MSDERLLLGGYTASTGGAAAGIGSLSSRTPDAALTYDLVVATPSPSFLARGRGVVYAVDEAGDRVEAFAEEGGSLRHLGGRATSGTSPCHITVSERWLYVSNYGSGTVDVFALEPAGAIGPLHQSLAGSHDRTGPHPAQETGHAHATLVIGETLLIANLGLDSVDLARWRGGRLEPLGSIPTPPGSGPRDFAVTPDGTVWVLGELSGEIFRLGQIGSRGAESLAAIAAVPSLQGDHAAALAVGRDGRFLYTGLRGSNRIAVVSTDDSAAVEMVDCGGDWPRHLAVIGSRLYAACECSSTVEVFDIDGRNGIPTWIERVPAPTPTYLLAMRAS